MVQGASFRMQQSLVLIKLNNGTQLLTALSSTGMPRQMARARLGSWPPVLPWPGSGLVSLKLLSFVSGHVCNCSSPSAPGQPLPSFLGFSRLQWWSKLMMVFRKLQPFMFSERLRLILEICTDNEIYETISKFLHNGGHRLAVYAEINFPLYFCRILVKIFQLHMRLHNWKYGNMDGHPAAHRRLIGAWEPISGPGQMFVSCLGTTYQNPCRSID